MPERISSLTQRKGQARRPAEAGRYEWKARPAPTRPARPAGPPDLPAQPWPAQLAAPLKASSRMGVNSCISRRSAGGEGRARPGTRGRAAGRGRRDGSAVHDHVHRHLPRRAFAADERGRLVVADENHDEVAIGALAEQAADPRVGRAERARVARPEVHPVRLLRPRAHDVGLLVGMRRQHPRPVGLIRRGRRERRVRAGRREEHEQRRARGRGSISAASRRATAN